MYFVCDIGGTKIRTAISWDGAELTQEKIFATPETFEEGMEVINNAVQEYAKNEPVAAAAFGIAGVMDAKKNKLFASPHLPGWVGKPVGEKLAKITGVRAIVENDAVMGGLGEARVGAGRRTSIVGFLTIGTGLGGCKLVDGEVDAKTYGFEPGHQVISFGDDVRYLEEFASGAAMEQIYGKPPEEIDDPEAWDNEARLLAIGIHNVTVLWAPEMIVLGGSLMQKVDLGKITKYGKEMMKMHPKMPEIVLGELGDRVGLVGALVRLGKT